MYDATCFAWRWPRRKRNWKSQARRVETATRVCTILSAAVYGRECVTNKCLPAAKRTGICICTHNAVGEAARSLVLRRPSEGFSRSSSLPFSLSFVLSRMLLRHAFPSRGESNVKSLKRCYLLNSERKDGNGKKIVSLTFKENIR